MHLADVTEEEANAGIRHFVRFFEVPEGGRSRMWTAPNAFLSEKQGQELPGLSSYEVRREGEKWVFVTDDINVGSGMASLIECFESAVREPEANRVFLLLGVVATWADMSPHERRQFAEWNPGRGREQFDLLGTDGEPLLREFEVIGRLAVNDLVCEMIDFPGAWEETDHSSSNAISQNL